MTHTIPSPLAIHSAYLAKIAGTHISPYTVARVACSLARVERALRNIFTRQCNGVDFHYLPADERESAYTKWEARLDKRAGRLTAQAIQLLHDLDADKAGVSYAVRIQTDPRGCAIRIMRNDSESGEYAIYT